MQLSLDEIQDENGGTFDSSLVIINTARVWTARARRGLTEVQLARLMGVQSSLIHSWQDEDNFPCRITDAHLADLARELYFPEQFFTTGNQRADWEAHREISRQLEITEGWKQKPAARKKTKT